MNKRISMEEAVNLIKDGDTIMVGGFMTNGSPERLIDALVAKGVKHLTLICNDAGFPDKGVGKMVAQHQFQKIIASHIGLNKEAGRQMTAGETVIDLVPQGTLAERIRAGAYGLGGFLTPTGIGTLVEEGKQKLQVNDKDYLLELPLKADVALIFADKADELGNLCYKGSENNFNQVMAANAKVTIVEAREIVSLGDIEPIAVQTPGIFVNYLVEGE
ncbi:acetate CoA-transferase alpha subunit [Streptococcus equi subsp. zooepidemicus SzS31A1]|uniref:Acetate CoA-transferase alpha subunit n=2 Tax=Streptococcus equi subsp. zooepidemicus TaxID=40041 RepID=A0ABN0MV17_STRSZ|nr:3-oxoacid CoA-transferase subunit A [Streptococcus equi]KIS16913.1 acetate CoA-transferase alpha subunit [Streptococcus equi subsp. zooepidemicus Sz4is]EQB23301.1 acetate CoA-transferase alpha subunit [Streptococcus equi subsp. zooepidemicus SzS31A1]KIS05582.1 acetate CoA-transferase alpha subunit [Streptococcus equi subsp. zooepidemicus Sz12is]KIS06342.1 acetate CoA-transferase alpha subunit [Streptococcus equi subsp. zooepidemicus Sz16]KIS16906.1 acetate CoA-transferase alpha subunit [Str